MAPKNPGTPLRVGLAGLGAVSTQVLRAFADCDGAVLAAAADLRREARDDFTRRYDRPTFDTVEAMCQSPEIDAVWIATPNDLHAAHSIVAAEHGKHVLCEKPIAITLDEADRMIAAADRAGVQLLAAHSKIFDTPIAAMRRLIVKGPLGAVVQINSLMFNDWLQRPRVAAEVDTARGGGVVFRQAPHLVDIVRYLGGGMVKSVRGVAGRRDPHFATEGNFGALLIFESGAAATIGFGGYGHFDVTELYWNIGVYGDQKDPQAPKRPRRTGATTQADKMANPAFAPDAAKPAKRMPFFGLTVVSCERGAIRQSPDGLYVYDEMGCTEVAVPPNPERAAELTVLRDALRGEYAAFPDGRWGAATLEVCLAIIESARSGKEIALSRQVPSR
ncbi:MAG TPA: Gfo/Idh/MocA family oxidoreductase [Stellaceae bacterium]|jgi:phthalate 4,5-cis-dihydrodiol dehydrogenase